MTDRGLRYVRFSIQFTVGVALLRLGGVADRLLLVTCVAFAIWSVGWYLILKDFDHD